jgi:hypothetical protein
MSRKRTFNEMMGSPSLNQPQAKRFRLNAAVKTPVELAQAEDWNVLESNVPYYAYTSQKHLSDAIRLLFAFQQFDRLQHCIENNWITEGFLINHIENAIREFSADPGCVDALGQRLSNFFNHLRSRGYLKTLQSNPSFSLISELFSSGSTIKQFNLKGVKKANILQLKKAIFLNSVLLNFEQVKGLSRVLCWSAKEIEELSNIFTNITGLSFRANNLKSLNMENLVSNANAYPAFFNKIVYLDLSGNDLDKMPCLCDFLNLFPNLKVLKLESVEFLKVLAMGRFGKEAFVKINCLSLNENTLHELDKQGDENFQYLHSIFPNVRLLYLNSNYLYAMKPEKIAWFRQAFPQVTQLYFSNNGLSELQKCQLDNALLLWHKAFPQLRFIDISHNGFESNISAIEKVFSLFDSLEGVDLSDNNLAQDENMENEYIALFKKAFQNKKPFQDKNISYILGVNENNGFSEGAQTELKKFCAVRSVSLKHMQFFRHHKELNDNVLSEIEKFRIKISIG